MERKYIWVFKDQNGDEYAYTTEEKAYEAALLAVDFPSVPAKDIANWVWNTEVCEMVDQWLDNYHTVVFSLPLEE